MSSAQSLGSKTAKDGFDNEHDVADKFNNWKIDTEAQKWLALMKYELKKIDSVQAEVLHGYKSDVNVHIMVKLKKAVDVENIQVKLVSGQHGFNQIDKHWLKYYIHLWGIPGGVANILKRYTGELPPSISNPRRPQRMLIDEFTNTEQKQLLDFLANKRTLIICDILRGRGQFSAEWVLVAQKTGASLRWILKNMNEVLQYYNEGPITISKKGNISIGKIRMQRKGGDGGKETANMLQFKIDPSDLFEIG